MNKLNRLENALRKFTPEKQTKDILGIIKQAENYAFLVDLNTAQLILGTDIHGILLGPPYASRAYAEFKLLMNPRGVVDLFLTGAFHKSIFVKASSFPLLFDAKDKKKKDLVEKYGDILGASEESKQKYREHLDPQIRSYYSSMFNV